MALWDLGESLSSFLSSRGLRAPPWGLPGGAEVYNFRFAAGRGFKEKLERLGEVLGVDDPERRIATLLERALDLALEKKDPRQRQERRLERERRREAARAESRPDEFLENRETKDERPAAPGRSPEVESEAEGSGSAPARSRYIPLPVRERVLEKAGYRCEFTGPGETRCTARTGLEIEHERPFAIFRSHDPRFLRVFCRRHNLLSAERTYGREFIRGKIEAKGLRKVTTLL